MPPPPFEGGGGNLYPSYLLEMKCRLSLDLILVWALLFIDCSRKFGGRHDFDPSHDNHYTDRGIPCGEHTYPAIGTARYCACDLRALFVVDASVLLHTGVLRVSKWVENPTVRIPSLRKLDFNVCAKHKDCTSCHPPC